MMKYLFVLLFAFIATRSDAQSLAEDSVKEVITKMFSAMKQADSNALKALFTESAILQSISKNGDGKTVIRNEPLVEFIHAVAAQPAGASDERIIFETVKTDGPLGIAWTPYSFYFNGQLHHCGINSFQLVRVSNEWKIQYIIDTRRMDNCL